ncbi:hypothetical protein EWB00_002570 [Schistosoma japonicum]|uniref:Uncharacterized protein n=1 Tax=Schistosoma japonicum TaxID=6182 RepID=A0A4Z2DBN8_SCHJA|nr:hypothetical protein EWB00_002570 [Schistosoma japonicum]
MAQRFEDAARSTTNPTLFAIHDHRRPVSRSRGDSFHATEPTKRNCYYCKRLGRFAVILFVFIIFAFIFVLFNLRFYGSISR